MESILKNYADALGIIDLMIQRLTDMEFRIMHRQFMYQLLKDRAMEGRGLPYEITKRITNYM